MMENEQHLMLKRRQTNRSKEYRRRQNIHNQPEMIFLFRTLQYRDKNSMTIKLFEKKKTKREKKMESGKTGANHECLPYSQFISVNWRHGKFLFAASTAAESLCKEG